MEPNSEAIFRSEALSNPFKSDLFQAKQLSSEISGRLGLMGVVSREKPNEAIDYVNVGLKCEMLNGSTWQQGILKVSLQFVAV